MPWNAWYVTPYVKKKKNAKDMDRVIVGTNPFFSDSNCQK